jgi:hypothetical protein
MISKQLVHELLGLGEGWEVTSFRSDLSTGSAIVTVSETESLWQNEKCPKCHGVAVACLDHTPKRLWRHLDGFQRKTIIECALPRGRCLGCGRTFKIRPNWMGQSKHFTKDFEAFALRLLKETTVNSAGRVLKEPDQRLWGILFGYLEGSWTDLSPAAIRVLRDHWDRIGV